MLGTNVAEIGRMFEYDKTAYTQMFEEVKFRTFVFKFRTKMETYNVRLSTFLLPVTCVFIRILAEIQRYFMESSSRNF